MANWPVAWEEEMLVYLGSTVYLEISDVMSSSDAMLYFSKDVIML